METYYTSITKIQQTNSNGNVSNRIKLVDYRGKVEYIDNLHSITDLEGLITKLKNITK